MNILVIGLAALVLLLLILNARLLFTPRVNYYVVQAPEHRRASDGCAVALLTPFIIGVLLLILRGV